MDEQKQGFRSGFAILVGRTNVGKSTLLNALVGRKVGIVTPKPQTTRDTYHGVVHRPEGQIVLVDTPGIFRTSRSKLVKNLHHRVTTALQDIDVVIHVVDMSRPIGDEDRQTIAMLADVKQPRILCLNKADLSRKPARAGWMQRAGTYAETVEISALSETNLDALISAVIDRLPEGPPLYEPDQFTNTTDDFRISEIIREKVYLLTGEEVPYTAAVQVQSIEEGTDTKGRPKVWIEAVVMTVDDRRQRMFIGRGGSMIKQIRSKATGELKKDLGMKVALDLKVVVDRQWMDRMQ